ncbi:hypothetical protein M408DRAFT_24310 [Serendipita vermifera MAFF 305830]|uniref:CxC2-like cysteine cluster KDZ transposase-associated domain-containing protein n=1 Tax=Serendipita vermifera MAFF 305830 TaxID=933852 RepID=A0A0C3ASX4_SERVB|nr:hypothetical protein M408DRAFT_24310 [Serendipita vermifera MAFF 305830]
METFDHEGYWPPNIEPSVDPDNLGSTTLPGPSTTKRRGKTQHDFLAQWAEHQEEYLSILIDHEAPPLRYQLCGCGSGAVAVFDCNSCHGRSVHCKACILLIHQRMPFHRIKMWNGDFMEETSLSKLGLVMFFGHSGDMCPTATDAQELTVLHIDGFHNILASYCRCNTIAAFHLQLFEGKLFSASIDSPKSAFTFELLQHYRIHHLEGKGSAYTYIQSLYRLTNDEGLGEILDRVREFRRIARQWFYLQTRKDAGAYGPEASTRPLTVACPACPQPGVNIPHNWKETVPQSQHWLLRYYVHFDANFRLVLLKQPSRDIADRTLWIDGGFFANPNLYQEYLSKIKNTQQDPSDCSNHRASTLASRSRFEKLEITGVAGGVCRHECAISQGFVNLYKGERYVNSDFAISHILQSIVGIAEVLLSYDIACQYSRNFSKRFDEFPMILLIPLHLTILFLIPKFHLPVHKEECRYNYSFNYTKKVGRTDGEAIERFWSTHNHLSGSTMRMTPGSRLDTLNFHFNDWNWRKCCKMGSTLIARLSQAREMVVQHAALLTDLSASVGEEKTAEWSQLEDDFRPQPGGTYISSVPTRAQVLQRLTQFEAPELGRAADLDHERPALVFWVNDGLEIEESQARLGVHALTINDGSTERDRIDFNRKRVALLERINAWKARFPDELEEDAEGEDIPEKIKLPFPSSIPLENRSIVLQEIEQRLREALAFDSLRALRKGLAERLALQREKERYLRGQADNFRSQAAIKRVQGEITFVAERYKTTYAALQTLGENINPELMPLEDSDISAANVFNYSRQLQRGSNTTVSWIWRQTAVGAQAQDDNWLEEILRVQFLEVKITHDRWAEECEMAKSELYLTQATFNHRQDYWIGRVNGAATGGEAAHAQRMAHMYGEMATTITHKINSVI